MAKSEYLTFFACHTVLIVRGVSLNIPMKTEHQLTETELVSNQENCFTQDSCGKSHQENKGI